MTDPLDDVGGNVFAWLCDKEREERYKREDNWEGDDGNTEEES